ncbi:MAG: hypothetical protein DRO36_07065, partial [Candidatus Hecatellales archaeon]
MLKDHLPNFLYEESEIMNAIVEAIESEIQRLNNYIDSQLSSLFIETATGKALDRIGLLARVKRLSGESDENFRKRILASIQGVTGVKSVISSIIKSILGVEPVLNEPSPGVLNIQVDAVNGNPQYLKDTKENVEKVKVAGVQVKW